jgi:hypothetical protein
MGSSTTPWVELPELPRLFQAATEQNTSILVKAFGRG